MADNHLKSNAAEPLISVLNNTECSTVDEQVTRCLCRNYTITNIGAIVTYCVTLALATFLALSGVQNAELFAVGILGGGAAGANKLANSSSPNRPT